MAWLQSSFTSHQLLGDSSGSNIRKGYKVGSVNKNSDPDKSDTPLLHDSSHSPESENVSSDWFKNTGAVASKKQVVPQSNAGKTSFLSSGIFDRSGSNIKLKSPTANHNNPQNSIGYSDKQTENKKLLNDEGMKKNPLFDDEEEEEEDSEDEWCIPHSGGYQRVRPGAD
ncbi:uncharacterized protein LOC118189128 [Stegodyphus dumicola]|uniref:uncharacterized protein LOC118189128 n=1 Tax=Stegodyphus dumicola TaxID=202533 RepID=UPI0015B0F552|nr:uncharacterized protein LOC118189128 [Stegodyphus dumicola]